MAAPRQTQGRAFSSATQARIDRKAERAERFRELSADMMDIGRGAPRVRDSVEAAIDETLATTAERAKVRAAVTARDPAAVQGAMRELSAKKTELRGKAPAQPERRRPTPRQWLEQLGPEGRRIVEQTEYFKRQSTEVQARMLRLRDEVEEIDAAAEELLDYEEAQRREEAWLKEHEDDDLSGSGEGEEGEDAFGAWAPPATVEQAFGLEEGWEYGDDEGADDDEEDEGE